MLDCLKRVGLVAATRCLKSRDARSGLAGRLTSSGVLRIVALRSKQSRVKTLWTQWRLLLLRARLALSPAHAPSRLRSGELLHDIGRAHEAWGELNRAVELATSAGGPPELVARAHFALGTALATLGCLPEARVSFARARRLEPGNPDYAFALGNIYFECQDIDLAVRAYESAIHLRPDHARAYFNLGHAFKEKGLLQQAATAFRRALAVEPRFFKARFMLAYVYALMDLNAEAIEQYRLTIAASPTYVKAYYNLGNCYLKRGQTAQALEAYLAILEIEPQHARAHFAIGQAFARRGQLADALNSFQQALALKNDFPECHLAYARALEAVGKVRSALHHYRVYVNDPSAEEHRDEVKAHIALLSQALPRPTTSEVRAVQAGEPRSLGEGVLRH